MTVLGLALAVTITVVALTRPGGGSGGRSGRPDQGRPGAVILVPGYGGNRNSLAALADRLRAAGRTATVVALAGDGTGDLLAQADTVDAAVAAALKAGAPSVDLVGYSAGGVVTLLWAQRHGGQHVARRVVTLGSPLHGARIAAAGTALGADVCPTACQQLAPGSSVLTAADRTGAPAGLPWLSIWTENDETVVPPDSARLAGAVNVDVQQVCPEARIAHGQLPSDPFVTGLVVRALGAAPITAPNPSEC
jgi:triacylglycerol lipase